MWYPPSSRTESRSEGRDDTGRLMKLNAPQEYRLELREGGKYSLADDSGLTAFSAPASTRGVAKLYTLSRNGLLLYVGIAQQPMSSRLRYGFTANGKGGYHGYKWKHLREELRLVVWTAPANGEPAQLQDFKTVEAEVAFLCRQLSGQWPEFQHEIHFYPSGPGHRAAAERIYSYATGTDNLPAGHGSPRR